MNFINYKVFLYLPLLGLLFANLNATVVPHDKSYYKHKEDNVEIIYTKNNLEYAKQTASVEKELHKTYEEFYRWKLDETLYVGLISCNNQIANGFSSQWPYNRQINYIGGAMMVDYFSSTSWLHTLLYHETAHNYQVNVKGSSVSRALHSVLGNGDIIVPLPIIVPNVMENSFMLEGNAVLNESWHGNGGRLYSGRFKAQTILQAKAQKLQASELYNAKLEFPYGDIVYIQGAFFNLFLAQRYGVERLNHYFKKHSEDFLWPQFTNESMKEAVGIEFEDAVDDFALHYEKLAQEFQTVQGGNIVSSQFFTPLSGTQDEIHFIINEIGRASPELVVINKDNLEIDRIKESFIPGKVIKVAHDYYTQASRYTSPTKIYQGLYDHDAFIKEGTDSKVVQGYLTNGQMVYFDVNSSFSQPQLYVGDSFYDRVNSSVFIDTKDNLYYFKQEGKKRTLYKNKIPLYSYDGFYGIVSGVDSKGAIYFIANSKLGSSLFKYSEETISRASMADNIVDVKLIDDTTLLIAAIGEEEYYYAFNAVEEIDESPYETRFFFEDEKYYGEYEKSEKNLEKFQHIDLLDEYNAILDIHYSGSSLGVGVSANGVIVGGLEMRFEDPLSQNSASLFLRKNASEVSIAGFGYANSQYLLNYSLQAYGVLENETQEPSRDYGLMFSSTLPFYQAGYFYAAFGLNYFQDYSALEREPLSMTLTLMEHKQYGLSMYSNHLNYLQVYGVNERDYNIFGAEYKFKHDISNELYFGIDAKYSYTDTDEGIDLRGVKLSNTQESMDPSSIYMPSTENTFYLKGVGYLGLSLEKVLNFSAYYFTFPISLQREALYSRYRHYKIEGFSGTYYNANELRIGLSLSTVFLNSFVVPISVEYLYNDAEFIDNKHQYMFMLNLAL